MYEIRVVQEHKLIDVTLSGMLTPAEVADYVSELKRSVVRHRLTGYSMIIDVCGCPIQHQDVIRAMGGHMATMPKASALAVVTGSSLARMQIRRLFTQTYARIVSTLDEARGWVISGIEPST